MLPRLTLLGLILFVVVSGCASISKDECANANWEAIGFRDGSHGKSANRFNSHQKACAKHGFDADFARYMDGHHRGLVDVFCKPRKGYQLGLKGAGYNNVCPSDLEQLFLPAYHYGRDIYKVQRSYNIVNQQTNGLKNQLATLDQRIARLEHAVRNDEQADHAKSALALRNQRVKTTTLYDRMKRIRHHTQKAKSFEDHLQREMAAQNKRVERCTANIVQQPNLSAIQRRTIRTISHLCVEKGHLQSQIDWYGSNPRIDRPRRHNRVSLQRRFREILREINDLKKELYRHSFSVHEKQHLAHNFQLAEYAGALEHHRESLVYLRNSRALNLMIDMHFDAALKNLSQRIDFARQHTPSREARIVRVKRREQLHDARRQRRDRQRELQDMEQRLGDMKHKIDQMKAQSRY